MHANNELGTVQPIAEIARITREAGAFLHVDGVQALGKTPVDVEALGCDFLIAEEELENFGDDGGGLAGAGAGLDDQISP